MDRQQLGPGVVRLGRLGLSAVGVESATMWGAESVALMRGAFQARNRATAQLLRTMHVAGRATAGTAARRERLDEFSGDEVAAGLGWSRSMAGRWLELADDLVRRLPEVLEAMGSGGLDDAKARVISEWTRDLSDDHAHAVCADVLALAPGVPVMAVIERVQEVAVALDPDWAARRAARARTRARVAGSANPSGTATLAGYDLPLDEAAEALSRVEAIAAQVRARGVRRPIAWLRAAVYLRLLDGSGAGLDDAALVDALVTALRDPDPDPGDSPGDDGPRDDGPRDEGPRDDGPRDDGPRDDGPRDDGPGDDGPRDDGPGDEGPDDRRDDEPGDEPGGESPGGDEPDDRRDEGDSAEGRDPFDGPPDAAADAGEDDGDGDDGDGDDGDDDGEAPEVTEPPAPAPGLRRGAVEVRLRLSTALGLNDLPARAPGWGTVLADTARTMITYRPEGEWRIVVTDDQGRLLHVLLTRHRPPGPRPRRGSTGSRDSRGRDIGSRDIGSAGGRDSSAGGRDIVELQVPATMLAALVPHRHPGWARLIADAQDRLAALPAAGSDPDHAPAAGPGAARRRARAELDRWVRVRDRHCVAPTCRRRAQACDLDHTRDWAHGGPSVGANLGPVCRHHHRAKHEGGWRLRQLEPGLFLWTSRAGASHLIPARRITEPLPVPLPTPHGPRPVPDPGPAADGWRDPDPDPASRPFPRAADPPTTRPTPDPPKETNPDPDDDPPPF